jgi:hypothetical protein
MKKVWLVVGFTALSGLLTGVSGDVMHAAMFEDDWVEKGSFSIENDDGYPKNVQSQGNESKVCASFYVYTPYLYNAKTDQSEQLYYVNQACVVLAPEDNYATATGGEYWQLVGGTANKTNVYGIYGRLKSGVKHTQGCFVELVPTSYGQALGYKRCWDVCPSPTSVTTNGTDVQGRGYDRYTGNMQYTNTPVGFEGGGVVRIDADYSTLTTIGTGFGGYYGTVSGIGGLVVVHSPLNSAVRVDFSDDMDPTNLEWDDTVWSQRIYVKDCNDDSKAESLIHRAYLRWSTPNPFEPGYQEAFALPSPGMALKTAVDGLTVEVPENQR